jgi:hypothetical protein
LDIKDYKEKRDKGLIIDETNIHLYAKRINVEEIRRERANKCAWCGTFVPTGQKAPGGLCGACNEKADWNGEPGEDYNVGADFGRNNHSTVGFGLDVDKEEDPDVGF